MDQCTFGAGPLRGETESKRPAKKSEHARIFPFLWLTLSVKDGREIVPDPTAAEQPRGPRPHGLRHGAKPLKRGQVMSPKNEGESDNVGGLPTEFRFDESPVRAVVQDDEPWFVAKDVCDILGIDNPSQAVGHLDDDEKGITKTYTTAGLREMLTMNESGVYSVVVVLDLTVGVWERSGVSVRCSQAAIVFSFASGVASRKVCAGVLLKHHLP
jgi:hypothetical protein